MSWLIPVMPYAQPVSRPNGYIFYQEFLAANELNERLDTIVKNKKVK